MAIALHHSRARGTAKLVLLGIANHDGDGGAWPAVYTLQRYAGGVDRRNVQRALDELESLGEIRRLIGAGGDHQTAEYRRPNRYLFLLRCPHDCDRTAAHRTPRSQSILPPLDLSGAANTPPGSEYDWGGVLAAGGGGDSAAQTSLLTEPVKTLPLTSPTARARDEEERSAPTPQPRSQPPCPARTRMPCTYPAGSHVCMDCHQAAPPWAQPEPTTAEDDRRAVA